MRTSSKAARHLAAFAAVLVTVLGAQSARAQMWHASADYSSTQGANNWRYMLFRESDSSYAPMVYGYDTYWGIYLGWPSWSGRDDFGNDVGSAIFSNWMQPTGGPGYEAARVWESPLTGTVRVAGTVASFDSSPRDPNLLSDGIHVSIWKNDELLFQADIADADTIGYPYDLSVDVMPGDWLIFRVGQRTTPYYDATLFDPRIMVTSSSGSSQGSWIADALGYESADVEELDLSLFEGNNDNVRGAHRMTLAHELKVASNRVASGETTAAVNLLGNVLVRLQNASPPDWMGDSPEKQALRESLWQLINILREP